MPLFSCGAREYTVSRPLLGTIVTLKAVARPVAARSAFEAAFSEIARIESVMSPYRRGADIFRINEAAAGAAVSVSRETLSLINRSLEVSRQTGGAFDISFAGLAGLWNFKAANFRPPAQEEISRRINLVNYRNIRIDSERQTVQLARRGMRIGLGGIAKGYAVKRAAEVMRISGIESGLVEEGGDVQVIGSRGGQPWRAGLIHPREKRILLAIDLFDGECAVTSGDYERSAFWKGRRYHHIINPATGFPAEGLASVTLVGRDPVESDALATAVFVMGPARARKFLAGRSDVAGILVDGGMNVYAQNSLRGRISPSEGIKIIWF